MCGSNISCLTHSNAELCIGFLLLTRLLKLAGLGRDAPLIAAMVVAAWWFAWRRAVEQVQAGRVLSRVRANQRATLERAFAALNMAFPQKRKAR